MFSDPDPLEQDMSVLCETMTPDQLIAYIKSYHEAFGLILQIDGQRERSVLSALIRTYGRRDAGRIVKWAFYRYKGTYSGEPITVFSFSKGRKWWTDRMHLELQEALRRETPRTYSAASLGGRGLADL